MNDAKDEAISKLTKAIVALGIAVLLLSLVLTLFSFTSKQLPSLSFRNETKTTQQVIGKGEKLFIENIDLEQGKNLFKQNCSSCHHLPPGKCGPGIEGFFQRTPSPTWFITFIRSQQSLIEAKDPYTLKIMREYNVGTVHSFSNLTQEEVLNIGVYISSHDSRF